VYRSDGRHRPCRPPVLDEPMGGIAEERRVVWWDLSGGKDGVPEVVEVVRGGLVDTLRLDSGLGLGSEDMLCREEMAGVGPKVDWEVEAEAQRFRWLLTKSRRALFTRAGRR
jgi:hypothetical protein